MGDDTRVEIRRRFAATPEKVFAAFAKAEVVSRWLRPSPEISLTVLQFEFRAGGAYRFAYGVPEGGTVVVTGTYQAIEPPSRIVFSCIIEPPDEHAGIDSLVTITIRPKGVGSELVVLHERLMRPDAVLRHREGWRGALDGLEAMLDTRGRTAGGAQPPS
jgi:uncharacterized protein YndB with AHSA1/START domain